MEDQRQPEDETVEVGAELATKPRPERGQSARSGLVIWVVALVISCPLTGH